MFRLSNLYIHTLLHTWNIYYSLGISHHVCMLHILPSAPTNCKATKLYVINYPKRMRMYFHNRRLFIQCNKLYFLLSGSHLLVKFLSFVQLKWGRLWWKKIQLMLLSVLMFCITDFNTCCTIQLTTLNWNYFHKDMLCHGIMAESENNVIECCIMNKFCFKLKNCLNHLRVTYWTCD